MQGCFNDRPGSGNENRSFDFRNAGFWNRKNIHFHLFNSTDALSACSYFGTNGQIEIEIPVNAPKDASTRIWVRTKNCSEEIVVDAVDQYSLQAYQFSKAILENTDVPTPLEDAVKNMKVIDAIFESARQGKWENI